MRNAFVYRWCRLVVAIYLCTCPQSVVHDSRHTFEFVRQQFAKMIELKSLIVANCYIADSNQVKWLSTHFNYFKIVVQID